MNNKGIILSVYIYVLLVFFLLVLSSLLIVLNNTTILSKRVKDNATEKADTTYNFTLEILGPDTICVEYGVDYVDPGYSADDLNGKTVGVVTESTVDVWKLGTYRVKYTAKFNNKEKIVTRNVIVYEPDFDYTGSSQTFTVPCDGVYNVELWGAAGDTRGNGIGGKGGYTKGSIFLHAGEVIYVYVGEGGKTVATAPTRSYTFNGGGYQGTDVSYAARGGGATDIRLVSGAWSSTIGLTSRIMVAGAGASGYNYGTGGTGGYGGGLSGTVGQTATGTVPEISIEGGRGGTQLFAGNGGEGTAVGHGPGLVGAFGLGGVCDNPYGGGGGAGYYGGGGGGANSGRGGGGGGGSSFISGYIGCNAVDSNGNITDQPVHYSGMQFSDMIMLSGIDTMPSTNGSTEVGHSGNGYARIKYMTDKTDSYNNEYTMEKFISIGEMNAIRLQLHKPTSITPVMVRRKTTSWTSSDTITTGTLISNDLAVLNSNNSWYIDAAVTNGTTYYYKAFPFVNGQYISLNGLNETSAIAGGLYAEFNFENNLLDTADYSGNNNISSSVGITYKNNGKVGSSTTYNGSNVYAFTPAIMDSGAFSVSAWVKIAVANPATNGYIVSNAEGGGFALMQMNGWSSVLLAVNFGGTWDYITIPVSSVGKWVHVVAVINTTTRIVKLYYNGTLVNQKYYTGAYVPSSLAGADRGTCIGCNPDASLGRVQYFNGDIDQVKFFSRELTNNEVLSLYKE